MKTRQNTGNAKTGAQRVKTENTEKRKTTKKDTDVTLILANKCSCCVLKDNQKT